MSVTPTPSLSPVTDAPQRLTDTDPLVYAAKADAFAASLETFGPSVHSIGLAAEANATSAETAADAAVGVSGYMGLCAGSLNITSGSQTFTQTTGLSFAATQRVTAIRLSNPTVRMRGEVTGYTSGSGSTTVTFDDVPAGGGSASGWAIILSALESISPTGKQAFPIPASAMTPRAVNAAAFGRLDSATNKIVSPTFDFDASTIEYVQFAFQMPRAWDEGTITFVPVWTHGATATNFKVSWGLRAVAISDGDALDAAFGTGQFSNDTGGTTDTLYIGPESAAITVAGSPQAGDWVVFEVYRKADDATNDTLAVDARLHGVTLYLTTNTGNDA